MLNLQAAWRVKSMGPLRAHLLFAGPRPPRYRFLAPISTPCNNCTARVPDAQQVHTVSHLPASSSVDKLTSYVKYTLQHETPSTVFSKLITEYI